MSNTGNYLTFSLGELFFGITATDVLELNNSLEVTPVPKSPPTVRGIANLRGQIVPAINMYALLGLKNISGRKETISIILKCEGILIAVMVDKVGDIISLEEDTFEPPPNNFSPLARDLVMGVHKLPDRLLLILDYTKILGGITMPAAQRAGFLANAAN